MPHAQSTSQQTGAADTGARQRFLVWLAYIGFVVYGSLVPMELKPLSFDQAWAAFQKLPMLHLAVWQRADWIANGVLYFPAGFLTFALFARVRSVLGRLLVSVGAALFCFSLALTVEFTQQFFAPRTVSMNDVVAEWIGSVLGIIAACFWSEWFRKALAALAGKLGQLTSRVLQMYALGYVAFSLFPFDFLLSAAEFADKVDSGAWGWFLSEQSTNRGPIILAAKVLAEILAVIPLGVMLGRRNVARQMPATRHAVLYGTLLALALEAAQFLTFSGVSQGVSLLTRAAGMYCGARLWRDRAQFARLPVHAANRRLLLAFVVLYPLALAAVNGWFSQSWHGMAGAGKTFALTRWLPFYYHYYTTEHAALLSLASVALMYAPVGAFAWLRSWSPAMALWTACLAASVIESSKLFLTGLHPDPTNLLIAGVAAWSVTTLLQKLQAASAQRKEAVPPAVALSPQDPVADVSLAGRGRRLSPAWLAVSATVLLTAWVVIDFPFAPLLFGTLLVSYAALLWFKPLFLWVAIPAAIPLLDLAPLSGRFYLDEFDFLIMISLVLGFARIPPAPRGSYRDLSGLAVACLMALSIALSATLGMLPLALPDANSFNNYYSPYNALRIAKGALWALLLLALMHRFTAGGRNIRGCFAAGMVTGLAGTVAVVIWERAVFPGLFNFADIYRVTGPFSAMHTGGADIETYLTAALPFAVVLTLRAHSLLGRLTAGLLILAASYAIGVTFSRAGYAGFAAAFLIACLSAVLPRRRTMAERSRRDPAAVPVDAAHASHSGATTGSRIFRWAAPAALLALAAAVVLPIYSGAFAQERLAMVRADLAARQAHWADALAMRDPGLLTALLGMGIGRFPQTHYWRSSETRAGSYQLSKEAANTFLTLGAGHALYMEQLVSVAPDQEYLLHLDTRSPQAGAVLSVSLCEKLLLTSRRCVSRTISASPEDREWQQHELRLPGGDVGRGPWLLRPPVKLSLYNTSHTRIDIDNVQLLGPDGQQLSRNGDFASGLDQWFFAVDRDLPWHIWSMPVTVFFDQGLLGILAFAALLGLGLTRTARQALTGDLLAGATLAALTGILLIATVDSIIDTPRFLLLLILLSCVGWGGSTRRREHGR